MAASMNKVDRGRIVDGKWTDVENIWQAPYEFYQGTPDTGAGGRLAFDDAGHVFLSVGIKSADGTADTTPQDLSCPYGKIHRVNDDGSIPADNPFASAGTVAGTSGVPLPSIWTYGHRSPQGLEWNPTRKAVWDSEMGPRGGDELNELIPGHNYGWPYYSRGLEYAGNPVERHKLKSIEFDDTEVEQTLVDITPSPAISSFVVYEGDAFPQWQNNVLIGSLKGSSLFRMVFDGNRFVHSETLIKDLARIRDIEVGTDGLVYMLLENKAGSSIVRLLPAT
jgi:glucose/arabinose dehydrogenase